MSNLIQSARMLLVDADCSASNWIFNLSLTGAVNSTRSIFSEIGRTFVDLTTLAPGAVGVYYFQRSLRRLDWHRITEYSCQEIVSDVVGGIASGFVVDSMKLLIYASNSIYNFIFWRSYINDESLGQIENHRPFKAS